MHTKHNSLSISQADEQRFVKKQIIKKEKPNKARNDE